MPAIANSKIVTDKDAVVTSPMGTPVKKSEPENVANVVDLYVDQLGPCGIPLMRLRHAACIVGDHLYIHGGRSGYRALRDFWRLNLKRLEWEAIQPINQTVGSRPGLLEDHIMVNYGSNLFLIGSGSDYLNRQEMQIWKFCPESWNWSRWIACKNSREHPLGRRSATGTMVANKLYIFGGIVDLYAKPTADLIELDLDNQAWSIVETWGPFVISPIYGHSTNFYSGRLIVFGGIKDQKAQNAVWSFDLSRKKWSRITTPGRIPPARHGHSAAISAGCLYIHGGQSDQRLLGDMWSFNFSSEIWTKIHLSEPCLLSHHIAQALPPSSSTLTHTATDMVDGVTSTTPFLLAENHFTNTCEPYIRSDSHEYLIPDTQLSQYSYDNEAIEMEVVPGSSSSSRKVVRNLSASSEKRAKDKSKKLKSEERNRASMRSLTNVEHLRTDNGQGETGIELGVLARTGSVEPSERDDVIFVADTSRQGLIPGRIAPPPPPPTSPALVKPTAKFQLLLIGGESDELPLTAAKRLMRIKTLEICP